MIRYLRTFVIAAQTSSFSAAGMKLGLTQSAVSIQIRKLEEEFGTMLFERTGKSVSLSDAGQALLPDAIHMLDLYDRMKGASQGSSDSRPIDLGAISTVQAALLPKALRSFRSHFPNVHINIIPGMSTQLLTQIDAKELDIAVIIKPRLGIPPDLKWILLIEEHYVVVLPADWPQDLPLLAGTLPFIRYNRNSYGGHIVDRYLKQHHLWVQDGMELDEPSVILEMVSEGLGWSIIPGGLVPLITTKGIATLPLPGRPLSREIGVLVRVSTLKRRTTALLIDSLREEAKRRQGIGHAAQAAGNAP
ncbi:LysR family transcriptional regulator [Noviherbaspirillum saxi]|uniref:LysR family transcriptional regulator n=1 Tax=Noviherbaspirillum saxi TaxID=2320863 RepID=A0A3A3FJB0_9BURK|nr:LysR family transcriptional regulator [Noviherbaspirillum saxi]RJF92468.1 LysR family transcriptional regulator [Noviherbaspirillum saxi]